MESPDNPDPSIALALTNQASCPMAQPNELLIQNKPTENWQDSSNSSKIG
jgi:hypothetical protein